MKLIKNIVVVILIIIISTYSAFADMPGNKTMSDSKVSFQGLDKFNDWDFFFEAEYGGYSGILSRDTTVAVPGSRGKPASAFFWAVNKRTGESTDSIDFGNYFSPDYLVIVSNVRKRHLDCNLTKLSNGNSEGDEDTLNLNDVENQQLISDAKDANSAGKGKYLLYIGLPLAALIILIIYFIRRKK